MWAISNFRLLRFTCLALIVLGGSTLTTVGQTTIDQPGADGHQQKEPLEFKIPKIEIELDLSEWNSQTQSNFFDRTIIPTSKNAASRYLTAFAEFSDEMICCMPIPNPSKFESHFPHSSQRRAEICKIFDEVDGRESFIKLLPKISKAIPDWDKGIRKVKLAQELPLCYFDEGNTLIDLLPNLESGRTAAKALVLKILHDVNKGEVSAAISNLEVFLRLSRDVRNLQGSVAFAVSLTLEQYAIDLPIPAIIYSKHTTGADQKRLIAVIEEHLTQLQDGWDAFEKECLRAFLFYQMLEQKNGCFAKEHVKELCDYIGLKSSPGGAIVAAVHKPAKLPMDSKAARNYDIIIQRLSPSDFERCRKNCIRLFVSSKKISPTKPARFLAAIEDLLDEISLTDKISFLVLPNPILIPGDLVRRTRLKILQCHAAIQIDSLNSDQRGLAEFCENAGMVSVPADEFTGKALQLIRRKGNNLIYAIGPDRTDHKAEKLWDNDFVKFKGNLVVDVSKFR